jgi:hypothetical protein
MSCDSKTFHHVTIEEIVDKIECPYCHKYYTAKKNLNVHISGGYCTVLKERELDNKIQKKVDDRVQKALAGALCHPSQSQRLVPSLSEETVNQMIDKKLGKIKKSPVSVHNHNHNQNLNVMCLGSKDNLLDILANQGDLPLALTWIRDAALGKLASDCRILERVYLPPDKRPAILYRNKTKNQFVYYDENNERQIETNPAVLAKKLADILQRSYLKGMESLKTDLAGNARENYKPLKSKSKTPMPEVQAYDLQIWNAHIHELNDEKYQKRLLKSMKLPIESDM